MKTLRVVCVGKYCKCVYFVAVNRALVWRQDVVPSAGDGIMDVYHHYGVLCVCVVIFSWQVVHCPLETMHEEEYVSAENVFFKGFQ